MEWPTHPPPVGGGGVSVWYQRISVGNHEFWNSKYIYIK